MSIKESEFWQFIRKKLKEYKIQFDRIESYTSKGIADLFLYMPKYNQKIVPVELKSEQGNKVNLRPEQKVWHYMMNKNGIRTFILVRRLTAKLDQIELYTVKANDPDCGITLVHTINKLNNTWNLRYIIDTIEEFLE